MSAPSDETAAAPSAGQPPVPAGFAASPGTPGPAIGYDRSRPGVGQEAWRAADTDGLAGALSKAQHDVLDLKKEIVELRREFSELKAACDVLREALPGLHRRVALVETWGGCDGELDMAVDRSNDRVEALEAQIDSLTAHLAAPLLNPALDDWVQCQGIRASPRGGRCKRIIHRPKQFCYQHTAQTSTKGGASQGPAKGGAASAAGFSQSPMADAEDAFAPGGHQARAGALRRQG